MDTIYVGLATGAIYALAGFAFNLVYLFSGLINLAQAQYVTVGAFAGYFTGVYLHTDFWVVCIFGGIGGLLVGLLQEALTIRPLRSGGHTHNVGSVLLTTLGFGVIIDGISQLAWGTNGFGLPYFESISTVSLFGGEIRDTDLATILVALVLGVGVQLWSRRTVIGLSSLAATEDRQTATLCGVNIRRLTLQGFAIAGLLLGLLAPLIAIRTTVVYNIGDDLTIFAFVVLTVGGLGNFLGALVGGLLLGVVVSETSRYLNTDYAQIVSFGVFVLLLLLRPKGLSKAVQERTV
jgi:branched-chain amino acid transport system permease protein